MYNARLSKLLKNGFKENMFIVPHSADTRECHSQAFRLGMVLWILTLEFFCRKILEIASNMLTTEAELPLEGICLRTQLSSLGFFINIKS